MLPYLLTSVLLLFTNSLFSDNISISGNPPTLTISTATAGSNPNSATNNTTTYNITTTTTVRSILGKINTTMPTGTTLKVQLAPSSGASSTGSQAMGTTSVNLITNITKSTIVNNLVITYSLSATAAASPTTSATRILTLTLQ